MFHLAGAIDWRFWRVALTVPVCILAISAYCFTTETFLRKEYERPDFPRSTVLSPTTRAFAAVRTLRYVISETSLDDLIDLKMYNVRELSHLEDVRGLIAQARLLVVILSAGALLGLAGMWSNGERRSARRALRAGSLISLVGLGLLGLLLLGDFDRLFLQFHALFFRPASYTFDPASSLLVHMFPPPFWVHAFTGAALLALFLSSLVLVASAGFPSGSMQRELAD